MMAAGKLYYLLTILSCLELSAEMLVIAMVAACFLGRRIVITRKMILISCGAMVLAANVFFITHLVAMNVPEIKTRMKQGWQQRNW